MEARMKILVEGVHNDDKFNQAISELESAGWTLTKQYGGTMPNYKGHGADLTKNL